MPKTPDKILFDDISEEKNGQFKPLVEYCFELFNKIKDSDYRKKKIDKIKEARRAYEQEGGKKTFPWANSSNVVLPLVTITNDNLEPRLVAALTGKEPIVEFEMEGMTKKDELTEIIEDWYNAELKHFIKINDVAKDVVHILLNEGTVYPFSEYKIEENTIRDFQYDEEGQVMLSEETAESLTEDTSDPAFEGGKVDYVKFTDMYVPDDATEWEKTDFIRVIRPTYAELMRLKDEYGYMNIGEWLVKEKGTATLSEDQQSPDQAVDGIKVTGKETIECLESHLSYVYRAPEQEEEDITDFTEERIVAVVAKESKVLIRLVLLRDLNFKNEHIVKRIRLFPERGKAYGKCMYEKMEALQNGASDIFNLVVNIATVCMIPWFIYGDKAGLEGDVELYPGKGIKADDPSAVVFPKFQIQPQNFIEFINMFISLWERLGSIGDLQIGRPSEKSGRTAREVLAVIQEGNIKHNYQSNVFKEEFTAFLRTIYDLYYQHMPLDKTFLYRGKPIAIPRMAMRRPYKFKLTGSTELANKFVQRQEDEAIYTLLGQDPVMNPIPIRKDLIKSFKPDADPMEYINPTIGQFAMLLQEEPQLLDMVQKYLQDYAAVTQDIEGQGAGTPTQ